MQKIIRFVLALFALSLLPLSANAAATAVRVAQPAGVGCVAVKIVSINANSWGVMNCSNGLAYRIRNRVTVFPALPLPGGATSEQAADISVFGCVVGQANFPAGVVRAFRWCPGPGVLPNPGIGNFSALGIDDHNVPMVGWAKPNGLNPMQAVNFNLGAFIGPPNVTSFATDANRNAAHLIVGEMNGRAAVANGGGNLAPIAGTTAVSIANAVNEHNLIVGQEIFGGACGATTIGDGFIFPWPGGTLGGFGRLPGDCTSSVEDVNINANMVGYSSHGVAGGQTAVGLNLPAPFGAGFQNLNLAVAPKPWVHLSDAPGIDDQADIIATDGGAVPTRVYILW